MNAIDHLRSMTVWYFIRNLSALGAFLAAVYAVWLFMEAASLPPPQ